MVLSTIRRIGTRFAASAGSLDALEPGPGSNTLAGFRFAGSLRTRYLCERQVTDFCGRPSGGSEVYLVWGGLNYAGLPGPDAIQTKTERRDLLCGRICSPTKCMYLIIREYLYFIGTLPCAVLQQGFLCGCLRFHRPFSAEYKAPNFCSVFDDIGVRHPGTVHGAGDGPHGYSSPPPSGDSAGDLSLSWITSP